MRPPSQILTLDQVTFRQATATVKPERLLLLLHGWTGDENSMWIFTHSFPANDWLVAPRGPYPATPDGYSWRQNTENSHTVDDFRTSIVSLLGFIDRWGNTNRVDVSQFDVIGFSQGAAMAGLMALLHPQRVAKVGVLSGFLPKDSRRFIQASSLHGKSVFLSHGTRDETVPIERARQMATLFTKAGAQVTFCEAPVGHKLSADCLKNLSAYLAN